MVTAKSSSTPVRIRLRRSRAKAMGLCKQDRENAQSVALSMAAGNETGQLQAVTSDMGISRQFNPGGIMHRLCAQVFTSETLNRC